MYMENNKEFIDMMSGAFGEFTAYEVWFIITNQNRLGINTLSVQQNFDGLYYCMVDEFTVKEYLKKNEEGQI